MDQLFVYSTFAFSLLSFVAQARQVPVKAYAMEAKALKSLLSGPGNWISVAEAFALDKLFGMPMAFPSLRVMATAAKNRLLFKEFPDNEKALATFEQTLREDDTIAVQYLSGPGW